MYSRERPWLPLTMQRKKGKAHTCEVGRRARGPSGPSGSSGLGLEVARCSTKAETGQVPVKQVTQKKI